jgi:hypothetical protein
MKAAMCDVLQYYNNGEPARPFVVMSVLEEKIVNGLVLYETHNGVAYRSLVRLQQPDEINPYPSGEFVTWTPKQIAFEKKYPLNPDL